MSSVSQKALMRLNLDCLFFGETNSKDGPIDVNLPYGHFVAVGTPTGFHIHLTTHVI